MPVQHRFNLLTLLLTACLMVLSFSATSKELSPYEQRYVTPTKKGVFHKDRNIWVYTSSFAKRFGMPTQWIDDSLTGAEAIAYRTKFTDGLSCGFFGDPNACVADFECAFDIYLTDEDSANLPWKTDQPQGFRPFKIYRSGRFLSLSKQDDRRYDKVRKRWGADTSLGGLKSIVYVFGKPIKESHVTESGPATPVEYDREILPGLDYLQLDACSVFGQTHRAGFWFLTLGNRSFMETGKALHKVSMPDNFMQRAKASYEQRGEPQSLSTKVIKRIEDGKFPGIKPNKKTATPKATDDDSDLYGDSWNE